MEKVIDIEERIPSMRKKRRRKTNRKFIFILAVFVLALLVLLYFQSSFSRINKITVNGATLHEAAFYAEESGLVEDGMLWNFSAKDVGKLLEEIDSVQSASVSRKWIQDVEIDIVEWKTVAYIENEGRYKALLESGELFSKELTVPEDKAPILNGFTDDKSKERVIAQLIAMEKDVYPLISEIIFTGTKTNPSNITAYMDDGYEVRAVIPTFAEKMEYYSDITAQLTNHEKGVIDIEVGTFFTPYSKVYGLGEEEMDDEKIEQ